MLNLLEVLLPITDERGKPSLQCVARLDLTENTHSERAEVLANAQVLYPGPGYVFQWHDCEHDGRNKPCVTEVLQ